MALGSTQRRTQMRTRNLPGGKGRPARKADNLTAVCEPIVWKMWEPRCLTTLWTSTACYRDSFAFLYTVTFPLQFDSILFTCFISTRPYFILLFLFNYYFYLIFSSLFPLPHFYYLHYFISLQ
jgi:hypothetical protein